MQGRAAPGCLHTEGVGIQHVVLECAQKLVLKWYFHSKPSLFNFVLSILQIPMHLYEILWSDNLHKNIFQNYNTTLQPGCWQQCNLLLLDFPTSEFICMVIVFYICMQFHILLLHIIVNETQQTILNICYIKITWNL